MPIVSCLVLTSFAFYSFTTSESFKTMSRYKLVDETSTRLAMKKNEVEEFLLYQRKKTIGKEENKAIRQLQSLQKEKHLRGLNKQQQSSNKNAQRILKSSTSIPESNEQAKFTAIKSCLTKNRGASKKCQHSSSLERVVRWRRPSYCKEAKQTMNLSTTPVFSKTNNKELTHRNSLANIPTTSNNWKTWQRKLSAPESTNEILKIRQYFRGNKKFDSEVNKDDITLIPALQNNEKKISEATKRDNFFLSSLPPDKNFLCQKSPKIPSVTRQLSATETTPLKLLSAQKDTMSEKQTLTLPIQEAMYRKGSYPSLNFDTLALQENKLQTVPSFLNDSEMNILNTITPLSDADGHSRQLLFTSKSFEQRQETGISQFQGETSKEIQLTIKGRPSIKVEKELETNAYEVRACSVDLTFVSDKDKTIATQTMLRKREIERASTIARKLAQKRFGNSKVAKETQKIGINFGATPLKSADSCCEADKKKNSSNTMKSFLKDKQMDVAFDALSKDLKNCRYLRHDKLGG